MSHCVLARRSRRLLALLLLCAAPQSAWASSCSFSASGGTLVDFGLYIALGGDLNKQGNVSFNCLPTGLDLLVNYTVTIGSGLSGNALERRLYQGAGSLRYNLFRDAARTQVFGDGSSGTATASGTCAALCTVPVYGRLYGAQTGTAGGYADAVTVTINF